VGYQKSAWAVSCGDAPESAVGHDDQPCPSVCSISSSSGSVAGWSCLAAHRRRRTRSCWCCGMRSPRGLNTAPKAPAGRSRSHRSSPASSAGTCGLSGAEDGRLFRVPAAGRSAKASTAGSGTSPRRSHAGGRDRYPTGPPALRPSPCRAVAVAGLRRPARRSRCPRRAQRACPPQHLRPLHTRLRPDRQPAHRASPLVQPLAPGWPTKTHVDARNFVRHASVPQLDSTGHNWTWNLRPVPVRFL
jgi:hypothetical protein